MVLILMLLAGARERHATSFVFDLAGTVDLVDQISAT